MMQGFLSATAGSILIEGCSVHSSRAGPAGLVGICPQHDLVWAGLTGREHLQFYAGLHALKALSSCNVDVATSASLATLHAGLLQDNHLVCLLSGYSHQYARILSNTAIANRMVFASTDFSYQVFVPLCRAPA